MNPYSHADWFQFREDVIKLDGGRCVRCLRSRLDGVVLQVHHKAYVRGRRPWEYPYDECETLCKGCHAEEHGKIMPRSGWSLIGSDDLGDLVGNCELCETRLRHIYLIEYPSWGAMAVGTDCCDRLTGTTDARAYLDQYTKSRAKRKRFVSSPRWQAFHTGEFAIKQSGIRIRISPSNGKFRIFMDGVAGKVNHDTILDAKLKVFELIESGEANAYLERRRERLAAQSIA